MAQPVILTGWRVHELEQSASDEIDFESRALILGHEQSGSNRWPALCNLAGAQLRRYRRLGRVDQICNRLCGLSVKLV